MNAFEKEIQLIRREIRKDIMLLVFAGLVFALFVAAAIMQPLLWLIVVFPIGLFIFDFFDLRKYQALHRQYASIQNTLLTDTVTLKDPKVELLFASVGRYSFSKTLIGVVLTGEDQKQYAYVLREPVLLSGEKMACTISGIEKRFSGEFCVQCYQNTTVIRSLEKNTRFLRFSGGELLD